MFFYLINIKTHQFTWNKWYSKLRIAQSWNISMKSNNMSPNMLMGTYKNMSVSTISIICHSKFT